jgi:hypothetical protein
MSVSLARRGEADMWHSRLGCEDRRPPTTLASQRNKTFLKRKTPEFFTRLVKQ